MRSGLQAWKPVCVLRSAKMAATDLQSSVKILEKLLPAQPQPNLPLLVTESDCYQFTHSLYFLSRNFQMKRDTAYFVVMRT